MRITHFVGQFGAVVTLLSLGTACHTMRSLDRSQLSASPDLPRVWVTRASDRSTVVVDRPEVVGDTLSGQVKGRAERIPLSDVRSMQERVISGSKTRNLVLAVAAVGAGATVAILNSNNNKNLPKGGLCFVNADQPPIACCLVDVSNGADPSNC